MLQELKTCPRAIGADIMAAILEVWQQMVTNYDSMMKDIQSIIKQYKSKCHMQLCIGTKNMPSSNRGRHHGQHLGSMTATVTTKHDTQSVLAAYLPVS